GASACVPATAAFPHRLFARGRAMPTPQWLVVGILDWRSGLPYSVVNEALDFAGPRNDHRFPSYLRLELGLERRFKIFKYRPWIGVRADNALSSFLPTDVQSNIGSPAFGSFYNSEYRQLVIAGGQFDRSIDFLERLAKQQGSGPAVRISLALAYVDKVPTSGDIRRLYLGRDAMNALTRSIEQKPSVLAYSVRGLIN